ncbi:hypothetical protein DRQ26_07175 [bacterium]|nr:MAG: hypothetical protein DRQ26_07175 [bacterium]
MISDSTDFWGSYSTFQYLVDDGDSIWIYEGYGPYNSVIRKQNDYTCEMCGHVCEEVETIMEFHTWYGDDGYAFYITRCSECGNIFEVAE